MSWIRASVISHGDFINCWFFFFKAKKLPRKTRWAKGSPATMTITIATVSQLATFDGSVQKPQTLKATQEGNLLVQECCPFYQWGRGHLSGKATDKRQQTFNYTGSLQKLLLLTTYYTSEIDSYVSLVQRRQRGKKSWLKPSSLL